MGFIMVFTIIAYNGNGIPFIDGCLYTVIAPGAPLLLLLNYRAPFQTPAWPCGPGMVLWHMILDNPRNQFSSSMKKAISQKEKKPPRGGGPNHFWNWVIFEIDTIPSPVCLFVDDFFLKIEKFFGGIGEDYRGV